MSQQPLQSRVQTHHPKGRRIPLKDIRNMGFMAHIDAGKTTTTERILYYTGINYKMGEVHEGSATMDWMDQERERGITITSAATTCFWRDKRVNIIDTPGHVDFTAEVERSLRVLDGVVAIFCGVGGVEPQSETVWRQADKYRTPRIAFVNKMDREGADFDRCVQDMKRKLSEQIAPVQLPWSEGGEFIGVIDIVEKKGIRYKDETLGAEFEIVAVADDLMPLVEERRERLIETLCEIDEKLLESFVHKGELSEDEIREALRRATVSSKLTPVFCGAAFKNKGIQPLLDGIVEYLPSPLDVPPVDGFSPSDHTKKMTRRASEDEPFSALVFKIMNDPYVGQLAFIRVYSGVLQSGSHIYNATAQGRERIGRLLKMHANSREAIERVHAGDIAAVVGLDEVTTGTTICDERNPILLESIEFPEPVISVAIEPKSQADQDKLGSAMHRLSREDPTFKIRVDDQTGQTLISGMGELHLEVLVDRLLKDFRVAAHVGRPQVAYKETITARSQVEKRYVKQTGGRGQYAHVVLELEPLDPGTDFEFADGVKGGVIPKEYIPAIEQGIREGMASGVLAGYEMVDIRATLKDGSFHEVDSSEIAFKTCASMAFKEAARQGTPVLLEPIMTVEVVVPDSYMGDIISDLNGRRGKIDQLGARGNNRLITAFVPLAEMFGYATDLRSLSQGRADYSMEFYRYEKAPDRLVEELL